MINVSKVAKYSLIALCMFLMCCAEDTPGPPDNPVDMPKTKIAEDGAEMVLIPAGEFQMGSNDFNDEKPVHTVYLGAYYIDKYEVTNAQYKKFIDATGHVRQLMQYPYTDAPEQPVVGVRWSDAQDYAKWADKRLPTEAEWEKAARGGLMGKKYTWGDDLTHDNARYADTDGKYICAAPVGSFLPNGYGLYDMVGNVMEWCADWLDSEYYSKSPKRNPKGPDSGKLRVLRGGAWNDLPDNLRCANRDFCDAIIGTSDNIGFRCVQ